MHADAETLVTTLRATFPYLEFRIDPPNGTVSGHYYIDIIHHGQFIWCVQAWTDNESWDVRINKDCKSQPTHYGFTIIDEDVSISCTPDMGTGHMPTLVKYLKMLLPKE